MFYEWEGQHSTNQVESTKRKPGMQLNSGSSTDNIWIYIAYLRLNHSHNDLSKKDWKNVNRNSSNSYFTYVTQNQLCIKIKVEQVSF